MFCSPSTTIAHVQTCQVFPQVTETSPVVLSVNLHLYIADLHFLSDF